MSDEPASYFFEDPDRGAEIQRRATAAKRRMAERAGARFWERCLADPDGRKEIWRLLTDLNAFRTEFPSGPAGVPDHYAIWFKHGRSTYGFDFFQYLEQCDRDGAWLMRREHDPKLQPEPTEEPTAVPDDERGSAFEGS